MQSVWLKTLRQLQRNLMGVDGNIPSSKKLNHSPSSVSVGTDRCRISHIMVDLPKCFQRLKGLYVLLPSLVSAFELLKQDVEKIKRKQWCS